MWSCTAEGLGTTSGVTGSCMAAGKIGWFAL